MFAERFSELLIAMYDNNQSKLSKVSGIPKTTISGWLTMDKEPNSRQLVILADCFQCSTDYLLGREDDIGQINVPNALTQNEEKLLQNFRGLNEAEQLALLSISTAMQKNKKTGNKSSVKN